MLDVTFALLDELAAVTSPPEPPLRADRRRDAARGRDRRRRASTRFRFADGEEVEREIVRHGGAVGGARPRRRAHLPRAPAARGDRRPRPARDPRRARSTSRGRSRWRPRSASWPRRSAWAPTPGSRCLDYFTVGRDARRADARSSARRACARPHADSGETSASRSCRWPLADLDGAIAATTDAKTLIGLLWLKTQLERLGAAARTRRCSGRTAMQSGANASETMRRHPRAPRRSSTTCSTSSPTWSSSAACRATRSRPTAPTCCSSAPSSARRGVDAPAAQHADLARLPVRAGQPVGGDRAPVAPGDPPAQGRLPALVLPPPAPRGDHRPRPDRRPARARARARSCRRCSAATRSRACWPRPRGDRAPRPCATARCSS